MIRIATVTIAIGVLIMLLAVSITRGFNSEISSKMFDLWGHIYVSGTYFDQTYDTEPIIIDQMLLQKLESLRLDDQEYYTLHSANPVILFSGIIQANDNLEGLILKGAGKEYMNSTLQKHVVRGGTEAMNSRSIVLSTYTASKLGVDTGDVVLAHLIQDDQLKTRRFEITALFKTGLSEFDESLGYLGIDDMRKVLQWPDSSVSGYELFVQDIRSLDSVDRHIYQNILPIDLFSITVKEKYPMLFQWLGLMKGNEVLLVFFFLVVCLVNLVSILLIVILDKMEFIGVAKSLGIKEVSLKLVFLGLGMRIFLLAIGIGNFLAMLLAWLQYRFRLVKLDEEDYFIGYVPVEFDWGWWLGLNLVLLLAGVLALLIPLFILNRFRPSEIFRMS